MPNQVQTFLYTAAEVAALERTLSPERFATYVAAAGGDRRLATLLYEWNTSLSESLYGVLQALEVGVRNSMHGVLSNAFGQAHWYDVAPLRIPEQEAVSKAKRKLHGAGKPKTPGRVIAELSFGFWTALADKRYARSLWVPHLYKAFPNRRMSHITAHARLDSIRKLRNRVAHHEPITSRNLEQDLADIVDVVSWVCPTAALWLLNSNTLAAKLAAGRPTAADLPLLPPQT